MKYRINENPSYSVVPAIELKPDNEGVIKWAALYDNETWKHRLIPGIRRELVDSTEVLADCKDDELLHLSKIYGFPVDELKEIRELEIQYRSSKNAVSP